MPAHKRQKLDTASSGTTSATTKPKPKPKHLILNAFDMMCPSLQNPDYGNIPRTNHAIIILLNIGLI